MNLGTFYSFDSAYARLIKEVEVNGEPFTPRGTMCTEIRPAEFELTSPEQGLYTGTSRKLNYRFLAIETLQYVAGHGLDPDHARLLIDSNRNVRAFLDDDGDTFNGAYGPRLSKAMPGVINALANDPDTRQAVASIWRPGEGLSSRDVPCTLSLHFIRAGKRLDLIATMRSNDLNWGTPYDVAAFCSLQLAACRALNFEPGWYYHRSGSFHIYDDKRPEVHESVDERFVPVPGWPLFSRSGQSVEPVSEWSSISRMAGELLDHVYQMRRAGNPWAELPRQGDRDMEQFARMIRRSEQ